MPRPTTMEVKKINEYQQELEKYVGQQVTVVTKEGDKFEGICKAISIQHLNVILMTGEEKILFKDIGRIHRKRENPAGAK